MEMTNQNDAIKNYDYNTFIPLYLMSEWQEPRTTLKCLTIAIILPSGVGPGHFKLQVVEEGECLEVTVDWPSPLTDIPMMHKKWFGNGLSDVHPKILGFESALKMLRTNRIDAVRSTARIGLPFTVQPNLNGQHNLAWRDNSTRMVYLDLKAVVDDYANINDIQDFEVY